MNINIYVGRIANDIELKTTTSGKYVVEFSLAVKRPYTKDKTDFIRCVAWDNNAQFISRYFIKGQMIAVNGYLTQRNFEDKNGNKRTSYEVICDRCEFCESKGKQDEQGTNSSYMPESYVNPQLEEITDEDELPF